MVTTVNLPFENGEIAVPLPEGWEIVDTVRPVPHAKLVDERAALLTELDHPIGTSPLRDKELGRKKNCHLRRGHQPPDTDRPVF